MENNKSFQNFIEKNNLTKFVFENKTLKNYTTIKIGGSARYFIETNSINQLKKIFKFICENSISYKILGNGSNLLISDNGFDGVVISLKKIPKEFISEKKSLILSANIDAQNVLKDCIRNGISGLEFLSGIPCTIGGMIKMNAGAFGSSIEDIIKKIDIVNEKGEIEKIKSENIDFDYRKMSIAKKDFIILRTEIYVGKKSSQEVQKLCKEYFNKRSSKYLFDAKTFGSVFKNGKKYFAGELIEKCELKKYKIGDAQISNIHANFIINLGKASSNDVFKLMQIMKQKVKEKFSVNLKPEVKLWGDFSNEKKS